MTESVSLNPGFQSARKRSKLKMGQELKDSRDWTQPGICFHVFPWQPLFATSSQGPEREPLSVCLNLETTLNISVILDVILSSFVVVK